MELIDKKSLLIENSCQKSCQIAIPLVQLISTQINAGDIGS